MSKRIQFSPALGTGLRKLEAMLVEMQAQDEALVAERHRYAEFFFAAPYAYLITDASGKICLANHAAGRLFGASSAYLARRVLFTLVDQPHRRAVRQLLAAALLQKSDDRWTCSTSLLTLDRRRIPARVVLHACPADLDAPTFYWLIRACAEETA